MPKHLADDNTERAGEPQPRRWDARQRGWFWIDNGLIDNFGPRLGAYAIAVYVFLCRRADVKSQACFPSIASIAATLGVSRNTVARALRALRGCGLVSWVIRHMEGGGMTSCEYTLLSPQLLTRGQANPVRATPQPPEGYPPAPTGSLRKTPPKENSRKGMAPHTAAARDYAYQAFEAHFKARPAWTEADYSQLASLWKRKPDLTIEEFKARWKGYMNTQDEFHRKQGGSLRYFCASFDKFSRAALPGKSTGSLRDVEF